MKIKNIFIVLLSIAMVSNTSAQKTGLLQSIRDFFYTPPLRSNTPQSVSDDDKRKSFEQQNQIESPYLFGSMGLASPHGLIGLGVAIPNKKIKFLEWELGVGLPLTYSLRMSAGANAYLNKSRKQSFGVSLAYSLKPDFSTVVAVNNSDYTFYDNGGKVFMSPNSVVIRYGADITDAKGNQHNYWIVNNSTQAFYDFKSVMTLHFRYSVESKGVRTTIGYGLNFSKPYEFAYGNSSLATEWLEALTPGGIELSVAARLYQFSKPTTSNIKPMPQPLVPQLTASPVASNVNTVVKTDTVFIQSQVIDTDKDGVIDAVDKCPTVPGSPANYGCPIEVTQEVTKIMVAAMQNVQFETGRATLEPKSYGTLDQVAQVMREHPEYRLRMEGHTDNVGSYELNQALSQARANVCLQYLANKGIELTRLSAAGFGATRPISTNDTKEGREVNRRVVFIIY